ncbi:MAG: ribonuclease E/G, partial [Candidatus Eremiobacteraeota bacterium]|nr:ribonuclease E/G [Candidatus Eremiobacteraeota bacterium]
VVVDFIDMATDASRDKVIAKMEESLRRDRTRATIQSFSNLGLLEFTRKRIGKDLGAQLRGACPTCGGMGSVMSAQSVAIETFRQIRHEVRTGAAGDVVVHVSPTVAMQMDFWYESECQELAHSLGRSIFVRVDPMIHPEKARIEVVPSVAKREHALRVGDEHEVELLPGRLPNPTSAAAVVDGRVAEVDNGANDTGNFVRIRILDVDDARDYVLAELVTAGAKPRKRRGARRVEPSAAEQTRQLRELAEDAARQSAARAPIGISSATEEEEEQDKALRAERKGEAQPDAIIIGQAEHAAKSEGGRKRRRRRRGRGGRPRENGEAVVATPPAEPAPISSESAPGGHRRRRRRRRGRGGRGGAAGPMPNRHVFEVAPDGVAQATGMTAAPEPSRAIARAVEAPLPAVEPPPPSLSVTPEEPKRTKPVRRRRTAAAASEPPAELGGTASALALPAAGEKPKRAKKESATPKKATTRKKKTRASATKKKL